MILTLQLDHSLTEGLTLSLDHPSCWEPIHSHHTYPPRIFSTSVQKIQMRVAIPEAPSMHELHTVSRDPQIFIAIGLTKVNIHNHFHYSLFTRNWRKFHPIIRFRVSKETYIYMKCIVKHQIILKLRPM